MGVEKNVVEVLEKNEDGALSYNCTNCRLVGSAGDSSEGSFGPVLKQLLCTVRELATKMKEDLGTKPVS